MPDPKQMAGIPRPVTDLPDGAVSVRLIRGQLSNNIPNFPVELHVGSQVRTAKTDEAGRAEFTGLPAGETLKAVAVVDGERLESEAFPAPARGGIRLLLVATDTSKGEAAAARLRPAARLRSPGRSPSAASRASSSSPARKPSRSTTCWTSSTARAGRSTRRRRSSSTCRVERPGPAFWRVRRRTRARRTSG